MRWQGGYPNWIGGRIGSVYEINSPGNNKAALVFYTNDDNDANQGTAGTSEKMRILGNGTVGIGTTLADPASIPYKLVVNGDIRTKRVVVQTGWSDFVFEKKYKLKTLDEVEKYIQQNGHLPEIPSAKEVECEGGDVGELVRLQMQKIEELTLYIIEQNKRIEALERAK